MKIAWFKGDAQRPGDEESAPPPPMSQDEIMAEAERRGALTPILSVLLVPDDVELTSLGGDDWDDAPADANGSLPYDPPPGSMWLNLPLGSEWPEDIM